MKKLFVTLLFPMLFIIPAKATHIVGGDITVRYLSPNNFQITLTFYRDCSSGTAAFDASITLGIFDKATNILVQQPTLTLPPTDTLQLGDSCYTPPNLCVERAIYQGNVTLADNPNGYYVSWHRCCRNSLIQNIVGPLSSGYVFYAEVPDPVLQNSTPTFNFIPDAYMCATTPNFDNYSATDIDGDVLVYSLVDPLDCNPTTACSGNPIPPPSPGPYGVITWQPPYNLANIMGDPGMNINVSTGIISTNPPTLGVFVLSVRVEEFRNNVKIGEIRRDFQYQVLSCTGNNPPFFTAPTVTNYTLVAGDSLCFLVDVDDPNPDQVWLTATSELFTGVEMPVISWIGDTGISGAQSTFCIYTTCPNVRPSPYVVTFAGRDSSCYGGSTVTLPVSILVVDPPDGDIDKLIANVFTPNGDNMNDIYKVNATVNYCYDNFSIKIYNRWGIEVYESDDFFFKWDGIYKDDLLSAGVYYYILQADFKDYSFAKNGYIHLIR